MKTTNSIKKILKPKLKLIKGTRFVSFLFIGSSVLIAGGILLAANIYFNIDTGEVVTEQIQRVTGVFRATAGAIVGGAATQNPTAGYAFEVVGSTRLGTTSIIPTGNLRFMGGDTHAGFRAPATYGTATPMVYILPTHGTHAPAANHVLTWQLGGQLQWMEVSGVGAGDITAVGNVLSGAAFTGADTGHTLWFEGTTVPPDGFEIALTAVETTVDHTITLPAATGTVALGTGTVNHVAFWTGANTLGGEAFLALARGGTGAALTPVAGGIVHSGAAALAITPAGAVNQLLTSQAAGTPTWQNIAALISASNGLTQTGTTALTIRLGGALTEPTTITQGVHDMLFHLTGTGDFRVRAGATDIFTVTDDGRILFRTYALAETGKEVLREMIPIFGFDLPARTATTTFVPLSRVLEDYPFPPARAGTVRIHRFIIRYADTLNPADAVVPNRVSNWRVMNVTPTPPVVVSTFNVSATPGLDEAGLARGEVEITANVPIPMGTDDWRLEVQLPVAGRIIQVYQIFLAAYDQII